MNMVSSKPVIFHSTAAACSRLECYNPGLLKIIEILVIGPRSVKRCHSLIHRVTVQQRFRSMPPELNNINSSWDLFEMTTKIQEITVHIIFYAW